MSKIIVDSIEPNQSDNLNVNGDINISGDILKNGTPYMPSFSGNTSGSCIQDLYVRNIRRCETQGIGLPITLYGPTVVNGSLQSNSFIGDGSQLTNINSTFTGNTSGDCIQNLWVEYLLGCNGTLNVIGDVTVSGTLSANTLYGNGTNITQDITEITLSGSGSTTATTYLNYGINIVVAGDVNNFVARLPIIPIKGRTVTVINNCGISMVLYPSMDGGSINGVVNGVAIIPSDNRAYSFTCYENPAPGSWSGAFLAATGQYDSGEITCDIVGPDWFTDVISASDPARWVQSTGLYGDSGWAYKGLQNPYYFFYNTSPGPFPAAPNHVAWKPAIPWSYITKVTVYTNMTELTQQFFGISAGAAYNYYTPGSTAQADWLSSTDAYGGNIGDPAYLYLTNILSGTPTTTGTTTGSTSGFTASTGEPGTVWGELVYNTGGGQPWNIGDKFIQTATFPYGIGLADQWRTTYINACFGPRFQGNGIKFRYIIDYIL